MLRYIIRKEDLSSSLNDTTSVVEPEPEPKPQEQELLAGAEISKFRLRLTTPAPGQLK